MPFVNLPQLKLHYVQMRTNEQCGVADNLVMVHGLAANLAFWYLRIAPAFTNDFKVTLFDLRGHGRSGRPATGYTPASMAEDMRLMADVLGIERMNILAHSFGGSVALHFLRSYPHRVERLVLVDTHLGIFRQRQQLKDWRRGKEIRARLAAEGIHLAANETNFGFGLLEQVARLHVEDPDRAERFEGVLSPFVGRGARAGARRWLELLDKTSARSDLYGEDGLTLPSLTKLRVPTLAIYGDRSHALASGRALARVWPHAHLELIPDAGHFFPLSRPEALIQHAQPFLAGSVPGRQFDNAL